ncbi:hypothetical protein ETU10_08980 [Apibacter muscae]|uniref:SAM hydrolase/SAM-dependent halogenase family protein n=1 Tax=Apibacter muscae TaxID=2509004 RepID=UPI0011ADA412|nr:SAM-dependent chlorinase/fluorinase [Apibacter muscae]TWP22720.1 hypothetical protein ETU10_08980 [Apibacter muscae]
MPIITLTTDFGLNDFHVPALKGCIYSQLPEVVVVDISHEIMPFDLLETAFVVRNSYQSFPRGTVHIIGVDALSSPHVKPMAAEIHGHYFICNDNGILSLITEGGVIHEMYEITINPYEDINYLLKDLFIPVACHLARGGKLELIGRKTSDYRVLTEYKPLEKADENSLIGMIIYIDNYGNAVTNIKKDRFHQFGKKRDFVISIRNVEFTEIKTKYTDVLGDDPDENKYHGKALAIFNSSEYLQISMYKSNLKTVGGASSLMGLSIGTQIKIVFQ